MTEINLRLYISIFPRNSTEVSVTVEDFTQTTILKRTLYFSVPSYPLYHFLRGALSHFGTFLLPSSPSTCSGESTQKFSQLKCTKRGADKKKISGVEMNL